MENTQVLLKKRPDGMPKADDFEVVRTAVTGPAEGEALIQNLYISLDAGFRNWMDADAGDEVLPAMPLGQPVMGLTVGRVQASRHQTLKEGDLVNKITFLECLMPTRLNASNRQTHHGLP